MNLRPCLFCKSLALKKVVRRTGEFPAYILCLKCGAKSPECEDIDCAINIWNGIKTDVDKELLEALEELVAECGTDPKPIDPRLDFFNAQIGCVAYADARAAIAKAKGEA